MLRGKIAAIVNDESVVINLGSEHGVKPGVKFVAVYETGTILDPDNPDKTLGGLVFEIAKLQATNVQEKMTVCRIVDPYTYTFEDLPFLTTLAPTKKAISKVDPTARMIGGSADLKLKVGTAVVEAAEESDKSQSAKQESPK